ncbi:hypothetical protein Tco_1177080 [Tanacetum coccineum]
MLNKDNYVPWSFRLLHYAKSKPNEKSLVNLIKNHPYVRRMIHEPGDPNNIPPVAESTHEQTDDELTEKEAKQTEVDDQAIQTIIMGLPKDIYAAVNSCDTAQEIWLRVEQMMKGYSTRAQEKKAKLNKHFPEKIANNIKFLNNLQPEWKQYVIILHQTKDMYEVDYIQLYDFLKFNQAEVDEIRTEQLPITHDPLALMANSHKPYNYHNANLNGNENVVVARVEGNGNGNNSNQISKHRHRELRLTKLPSMIQMDQLSVEHSGETIEQQPATVEETCAFFESLYNNLVIEVEKVNAFNRKMKETNANLTIELARYKSPFWKKKNERLLRAVFSQDIMSIVQSPSVVETSDLQTELERMKESLQQRATSNRMVASSFGRYQGPEINPFKNSREDNFVPNKPVKASVRTKPITVSQPHVITKQDVNANSDGLSSTGVDNTRRPQPRSNTKNDRVSSTYKSSCIKNKEVEAEEHRRNLLLSNNKKRMSCECNNVKLGIQNDKSEVVCAMCKQCLITANHDVCVLNYVNDMNSHTDNQNANVSNNANQKKYKAKVKKSNKLGSKERLASPKPSKPRTCLRWSPTGRIFDLRGKLIDFSEYEYQSDSSEGDNACTSNHQEPTNKRFSNSTSFLGRLSKFVYGASTRVALSI